MQIFDFSTRFFSKMLIGFTLSSRPAGARNQFWGLFERTKPRYCRHRLIFKDELKN